MATKLAVSGPRFVAPDDMADVEFNIPSWDDVEPTAEELALDVTPDAEVDYFERMKVRRAERAAAKREHVARVRAKRSEAFDRMADVAHQLTINGATPPVVSMSPDSSPVMSTGYRHHVPLVVMDGENFVIYGTVNVAEQYAGTSHGITDDRMARVTPAGDLLAEVRRVAPRRTAYRTVSSVRVETGKDSRGKWARNAAALERADKAHSLLMRLGDASGKVYGSEVAELLGRKLTGAERVALHAYNKRVEERAERASEFKERANRSHGQGTAITRMVAEIERRAGKRRVS